MATPQVIQDGVTPLDHSNLGKFINAEGKLDLKMWYARIRFNGASWEVVAAQDSAGITTLGLNWDTDHVEITLTGYTTLPLPVPAPAFESGVATHPIIKASPESAALISVYFYDEANVLQTTETTLMDCNIWIIGA